MDEGKAGKQAPKWWSRPRRALGRQPGPRPGTGHTAPDEAAAQHTAPESALPERADSPRPGSGSSAAGPAREADAAASAPQRDGRSPEGVNSPPRYASSPTPTTPGPGPLPPSTAAPGDTASAPGAEASTPERPSGAGGGAAPGAGAGPRPGAGTGAAEAEDGRAPEPYGRATKPSGPGSEASGPDLEASGRGAGASVPPPRERPLHGEDPYATPPYGGPGPWAPAPPVQLPHTTPAHGVPLPPVTTTPPYGVPTGPTGPTGPRYEPWAAQAPAHREPAAGPLPAPGAPAPLPAALPVAGAPGGGGTAPLGPEGPGGPLPPAGTAPGRPGHGGRRRSRLVLGAVVLALVAGGVGGLVGAQLERNGGFGDVRLPQVSAEPGTEGKRSRDSIAGIARAALPGVVTLHAESREGEATGTGFVLDERGHILTNNHVVAGAESDGSVQVTFNGGRSAPGRVVGQDGGYDLAVVKVSGVGGLKPLPLGDSDAVRVGDPVVAIGAPYDLDGTVTTGIVSAKERPITAGGEEPGSEMSYVDALQTDAPINPGNSGGPLVDARGRVIGINSAMKAPGGGSGLPGEESGGSIGVGFAIPVNQGRRVAEELINDGRATHPVMGITLDTGYGGDGARIAAPAGGRRGVAEDGPADEAGLRDGDVVTEAGGRPVHDAEELIVRIRSHRPGDELEVTVRRGGKERAMTVRLGSATG